MPVKVKMPIGLLQQVGGEQHVEAEAGSVGELLSTLEDKFPGVAGKLLENGGGPPAAKRGMRIFVNKKDARQLAGLDTPLASGDEVCLVSAIGGG